MEIFERIFFFIKNEYDIALQNGQVIGFFATIIGLPAAIIVFMGLVFRPLTTLIAPAKEMRKIWKQLLNYLEFDVVQNEGKIQDCLQKMYSAVDKRLYTSKQKVVIKCGLKARLGYANFMVQLKTFQDISCIDYQKVIDYFEDALNHFSEGFNRKPLSKIVIYKFVYLEISVLRLKALWTMGNFEKSRKECTLLVEELGLLLPRDKKHHALGVTPEYCNLLSFLWSYKFDDIFYGIDKVRDCQERAEAFKQLKNSISDNQFSGPFVFFVYNELYKYAKIVSRDGDFREKLIQIMLVLIECSVELYRCESTWSNQNYSKQLIENFKSFMQKYRIPFDDVLRELALLEARLNYYSFLDWRYDEACLDAAHRLLWEIINPKHTLEIAPEYELHNHYGFFGLCLKEEGRVEDAKKYLEKAYLLAKGHYGEKFYKTVFWKNALVLHQFDN